MIKDMKPLSLTEAKEVIDVVDKNADENTEIKGFLKKFIKLTPEKARELREKIESLGIIKVKEESIVKLIDFLPVDASEINKIFTDVSLDEDETNKILGVIKEYK